MHGPLGRHPYYYCHGHHRNLRTNRPFPGSKLVVRRLVDVDLRETHVHFSFLKYFTRHLPVRILQRLQSLPVIYLLLHPVLHKIRIASSHLWLLGPQGRLQDLVYLIPVVYGVLNKLPLLSILPELNTINRVISKQLFLLEATEIKFLLVQDREVTPLVNRVLEQLAFLLFHFRQSNRIHFFGHEATQGIAARKVCIEVSGGVRRRLVRGMMR